MFEHIQTLKYLSIQTKSSLFRTQADIHLTLQQYTQACVFISVQYQLKRHYFPQR